jgi:hypothetical protein
MAVLPAAAHEAVERDFSISRRHSQNLSIRLLECGKSMEPNERERAFSHLNANARPSYVADDFIAASIYGCRTQKQQK